MKKHLNLVLLIILCLFSSALYSMEDSDTEFLDWEKRCNPWSLNEGRETPLYNAIKQGQKKIISSLLESVDFAYDNPEVYKLLLISLKENIAVYKNIWERTDNKTRGRYIRLLYIGLANQNKKESKNEG